MSKLKPYQWATLGVVVTTVGLGAYFGLSAFNNKVAKFHENAPTFLDNHPDRDLITQAINGYAQSKNIAVQDIPPDTKIDWERGKIYFSGKELGGNMIFDIITRSEYPLLLQDTKKPVFVDPSRISTSPMDFKPPSP